MKKTLCACMAAVLALASLPVLGASAEETTYALGDVDMDGVVTNDDATMISRYVLGYITLKEEQLKLADVNEDGVVDLTDVTKLYNEKQIYVLGDVDMDGVVTGHDTAMVSRYVLDDTYTLTEEQLKLADVNEDGVVDQADADKLYTEMAEFSFLTPYLFACDVEEININSWKDTKITYADGRVVPSKERFQSPQHAVDVVRRLLHKSGMILDNSQKVLGIELFAGAQAAWLRGEDGLSPATRAVYDRIRQAIPPVDQDVVMHPLMVQADELVKAHAISQAAEAVCGELQ